MKMKAEILQAILMNISSSNASNCHYSSTALAKFRHDALIFPHSDLQFVLYYLCGIGLTIVIYLGITCNILSIAVFARDRPTKTTSVFLLQALAIADSVYLFMIFVRYPLPILMIYNPTGTSLICLPESPYIVWMAENLQYLQIPLRITGYTAIWMVLVVTLDRYIALYYTLKANKLCRLKIVIVEILILLIYCSAYSVSKFLVVDYYKKKHVDWLFWTWDAFNTLAPVVTVFVLNFRIWRSLIIAKKWRTNSTGSCYRKHGVRFAEDSKLARKVVKLRVQMTSKRPGQRERLMLTGRRNNSCSSDLSAQELRRTSRDSMPQGSSQQRERAKIIESNHRDVTARLIAVATSYLICEIPMTVLAIYAILLSWFSITMDQRLLHILYLIAHAMQCVNSSINFGLYFFSGRRFRRNLIALFTRKRSRKRQKLRSSISLDGHNGGEANHKFGVNNHNNHDSIKGRHRRPLIAT